MYHYSKVRFPITSQLSSQASRSLSPATEQPVKALPRWPPHGEPALGDGHRCCFLFIFGLAACVTWLVMRLSGNTGAWDDRHRLALATGPLTIFILLTPIEELFRSRAGSTAGMMLVGLGALILLVWLARRTIKRVKGGKNE